LRRAARQRALIPAFLPVDVLGNFIAVNQMDPYDSDSSDGGPGFPSQSTIPEPLPFNDPNYETYKHGQQFMIVDYTANRRNSSEVSKIWQHGGERRQVDDGTMDRYWRCGHCKNKRILECPETGRGATSYAIRHLKNRHFINLNADHQALPLFLWNSRRDTLSCPVMSTECERVFSSTKKLIAPERNQLEDDIIEACECLKA
jgi:hypothetical protein